MTTWVLLRGLTREAGHWGSFTQDLADHLGAQHQVLALDLPGNGALHGQASPASVAGMAAAGRAQMARHGAVPPYVLVAMSLGAMVALQWCQEAPGELAGCVLINTSLRRYSPFWQRLQPHNYFRLGKLLWPGLSVLARESEVLTMTSANPERHGRVPAQWAAIALQRPVTRQNTLWQLFAAARYAPPRRRPQVPVLVLASAQDRLVSPRCSKSFALQWGLPLSLHPSAGHDLPLDDPDWVLQQVGAWWQALEADGQEIPGKAGRAVPLSPG